MNTSLNLVGSALLFASACSAFAASSVDLTVKGTITPSACTPSLPGAVDCSLDSQFGWLPHPLKNAAAEFVFNTAIAPAKDLTLTSDVALDGSTTLELKYL
ncbi:hypothetical protein [Pseudomonas rhodesiae]|uniref:hypothetical protein n=1 Tax=Pseudomonas rhodesiae TaxID=76760 RepID=UPI0032B1376D